MASVCPPNVTRPVAASNLVPAGRLFTLRTFADPRPAKEYPPVDDAMKSVEPPLGPSKDEIPLKASVWPAEVTRPVAAFTVAAAGSPLRSRRLPFPRPV